MDRLITCNNPGERKIVRESQVVRLATNARVRPAARKDDAETSTHRRQLRAFVARVKRTALTSKDEPRRIEAIQTLAAMVLVRIVTEKDSIAA